ncbi:MAG: hypothetical protein HQL70_11220 [Magnetococcales bacterium]|nr:hypothetical protein [Magnetococcales bacterium]
MTRTYETCPSCKGMVNENYEDGVCKRCDGAGVTIARPFYIRLISNYIESIKKLFNS